MPNRIIKESICTSRNLSQCSIFSQDLYKRLITYADDYGRFNADTEIILARLYAREMDCITQSDLNEGIIELVGMGKIQFYTATPRTEIYGCFPNWEEHQRIRDSKVKIPAPTDTQINDWYLKRFIPIELKIKILERDSCKCAICGYSFSFIDDNFKKVLKFASGIIHFDHIIPVGQGGRATIENLRTLCNRCNLHRCRTFSFEDILKLTLCGKEKLSAASRRKLRLAQAQNPIQSESESESNPIQENHGTIFYDEIKNLFNSICVSLPKIKELSTSRKDKLKTRWQEINNIETFRELFEKVEASSFCKGENKNKWKVTFDWLIDNDKNYLKVLEGNYDNQSGKAADF